MLIQTDRSLGVTGLEGTMAGSQLLKALKLLGIVVDMPASDIFQGKEGSQLSILAQAGIINLSETLPRLAQHLKLPLVDLDRGDAFDEVECRRAIEKIDSGLLWKNLCLPLKVTDRGMTVALSDPYNLEVQQMLQFSTGKPLSILLAPEDQIVRYLTQVSARDTLSLESLEEVIVPANVEVIPGALDEADVTEGGPDTPPIIRMSHKILADAIDNRASDIHLDPGQDSLSVRVRIDGVMHLLFELPKKAQPHIISRFKLLAGMDISERRRPQDGRFTVRYGRFPVDVRGSTVPTPFGEKMVFRVLVSDITKLSFSRLGVSQSMHAQLMRVLSKRGKMLLVTGPTGSGKTTTLYTCLNYMRDGTNNIITVEDPIEYRIPGINQIQVNDAIGMTFAKTLRSILRQDPDVILVGEVRDGETARIAFQAAQTGHLVLSTLHTNDAPSALSRLMGLGIEEYTVAASLEGVLAQRLVRKNCSHCAEPLTAEIRDRHAEYIEAYRLDVETLRIGKGCDQCRGTGVSGQLGVYSYMNISDGVADRIRQRAPVNEILVQARQDGFRTIEDESVSMVAQGLTSFDEIKPYIEAGEALAQWRESRRAVSVVAPVAEARHAEEEIIPASSIPEADPFQKTRILLVEDDPDMREILSMVLQKEMYEVILAQNGREGLELLFSARPSLILCDLMMPQMDGREFLKRIRGNPGARALPVIILTAVDSDDNEIDLLDLGATDFVSKTDSTDVMLSRVRNVLSRRAAR